MGSDLGKGFIVILLSCDLHVIQPLLIIMPDSTTSRLLAFLRQSVCVQKTKYWWQFLKLKSQNENQKLIIESIFILLHSVQ